MAKRIPAAKASRLSIRIDKERKAVIARAAKLHGHTISDFVLENVFQVATELLADEASGHDRRPKALARKCQGS